ncbi:aspartate/glutamate racemase family protein [Neorhizobium galegae]|uniref:Asp/Glu/hydantoin racemase n=1 Tax=Neorhizobium galegae bv. orientalis str. HAMBI 540 TaxID=1028800 RepID=A0A068T1A5_NEOGA|nr:arylsulfatase [Neorhizobium galegae]MCQ1854190.1 aspartate/glutamate racemase family protein [Neorhizobium galegae]CDN51844.1 Asp/Glu/hydantoin racemase [Neorhizobium galegae bv. orientalis str. HAMBI 540]
MTYDPRIFLFHATPVAMESVCASMKNLWPEAQAVNILDESLSVDRAGEGTQLSESLTRRFLSLGHQAIEGAADGILITCSAFGPAIKRLSAEVQVPVLMPNEAMFRAAMATGDDIGMVATFAPAIDTMEEEFRAFAAQSGSKARLTIVHAPSAIESLRKGDVSNHNRRVAEAAVGLGKRDAIMLAHFSTSRAAETVRAAVPMTILTAPDSAVARMKQLIEGGGY